MYMLSNIPCDKICCAGVQRPVERKCKDWRGVLGFFAFSSNKNVLEDTVKLAGVSSAVVNKHLPSNHAWSILARTVRHALSAALRDSSRCLTDCNGRKQIWKWPNWRLQGLVSFCVR